LEREVDGIVSELTKKLQKGDIVALSDLQDLDGRVTYFGRYLSNKVGTELANNKGISVVERSDYEKILQEEKLQQSGLFDNGTIMEMGKLVGANTIIFGTVSELQKSMDVSLKIMNVKRGVVVGGVNRTIVKTREIASLVGTITQSEMEKEKDLELQRQKVMAEIDVEKQKRLAAVAQEETEMRKNLAVLEDKLRSESNVIKKYEAKKAELEAIEAYAYKLEAELETLDSIAKNNVRMGMTFEQINKILGGELKKSKNESEYIAGRYIFVFNGSVLEDVLHLGTRSSVTLHN
jgi:hypothetical protein